MIKNSPLTARLKAPPTVETLAIASIPRDEKNVTIKTPMIPITPKVSTEDNPNKCHDEVVSFPKITDDNGIQKLEAVWTSQTIQAANQMKVPTKAHFSPIDPSSHE